MASVTPPTLPACPFCRGTGQLVPLDQKRLYAECMKCGAGSEPAEGDAAAAANWRRLVRAPEARPSAWFVKPVEAAAA